MDDGRTREPGPGLPGLPPDLVAASARFERALGEGDLRVLEELLDPGDAALRADGGAVRVGRAEIAADRAERSGPPRSGAPGPWVRRVHVRPLAEDVVLTTTEAERRDGGTAVRTRVWRRAPGSAGAPGPWRVCAAHDSGAPAPPAPEPLLDDAVWSVAPPAAGALLGGALEGPLAWARVAVQDVVAVAGHRVGAGVPAWLARARLEEVCAPALQRLLDAGADVVGVAQTDELAVSLVGGNGHYGTPDNPAAPGRTTGGSTSGPAAAVASGAADLALGTDTTGSLRVPASYCGLYALRPTHGLVPTAGVLPLAPSFDAVGLLARDGRLLRTAARALLAGADPAPRPTALLRSPALADLAEPATALAVDAALAALAVQTDLPVAEVDRSDLGGEDVATWAAAARLVQAAEAWRCHGAFVTANPGALSPAVEERLRAGEGLAEDEVARSRAVLAGARERLRALVAGGRLLCLPSTAGPAPLVGAPEGGVEGARAATLELACLAPVAGLPALALPWGRVGDLPVGLCVVGAPGGDAALLDLLDQLVPAREVPV